MGELKLETVLQDGQDGQDGTRTLLFQKNGISEDAWQLQEITLPTQSVDYHV